ncbi:MAG: hypothetical protein JO035_17745 [Betaproteobacteria bacterium]|nr:hypothetical protein [Betaproteobacteria bacterium]
MKLSIPKIRVTRRTLARAAIPVAALALIASVVAGREKPSQVAEPPAAKLESKVDSRAAAEQDLDLSGLERKIAEAKPDAGADPFARRSFGSPQSAPQAQAPSGPPALPFRYLGKAIEDGKLSVFLMRGDDSFSVQGRQKLDGEYRVDRVTESQVTFTHLPTKTQQVLDIPAVN